MRRLTLTLLLVVLVAIFGLGFLLDSLFEKYNTGNDDDLTQIQSFATGVAITLNQSDSPLHVVERWPAVEDYSISLESKSDLPVPASLLADFESGEPLLLETEAGIALYFYLDKHQSVLAVQTSIAAARKHRNMALLFTGLFYLGTLLLVLLWLKPLISRLNLLRSTAKKFGAGELSSRVIPVGLSYIRDIENDFNGMADKIQHLIDDNKLLSSAVSHDLRTPLARLRFGIDTLAEAETADARAQYLGRINNDLDEMELLVNSLLRYARLDNVLEGADKQSVSLRKLLHECIAQYYDVRIIIRVNESLLNEADQLIIIGCIDHLAMLINNLIQNAVEHAKNKLVVELSRSERGFEMAFCDDGCGIPEAQRATILKPFQRGNSDEKKSFGLGLAVVSRIAQHHNARIDIRQCGRLGGARISVRFPS